MSGLDFKWNKNYEETHIKEVYANYLYRASGILVQNSGLSTLSIVEDDKNKEEAQIVVTTNQDELQDVIRLQRVKDREKLTFGIDGAVVKVDDLKYREILGTTAQTNKIIL